MNYIDNFNNVAMYATRYLLDNNEDEFNRLVQSLTKEEVEEMSVIPVFGKSLILSMYSTTDFASFQKDCVKNELIKPNEDGFECTMFNVLLNLVVSYGIINNLILN